MGIGDGKINCYRQQSRAIPSFYVIEHRGGTSIRLEQ